jgi:hypothetical protein
MKKHIKVELTKSRAENIEISGDISADAWWKATLEDGSKVVYLNNTAYPKEDVVSVIEVKPRHGFGNMEGV